MHFVDGRGFSLAELDHYTGLKTATAAGTSAPVLGHYKTQLRPVLDACLYRYRRGTTCAFMNGFVDGPRARVGVWVYSSP